MQENPPNSIIIEIPPVDASSFHILEGGEQVLTLNDEFIYFSSEGLVEEGSEDESMPWKERRLNFRHFVMKRFVIGADLYWSPKNVIWKIDIAIQSQDDWTLYFQTRSEAMEVQEKILNWLLEK